MNTIAEIMKSVKDEWILKFRWGEINFTTETISVNQRTTAIKMYSDISEAMDSTEMMSFPVPVFIVGLEQPQMVLMDGWKYKDKNSANNVVPFAQ